MGLMQQLRLSGIGATDASAVLGLNPWRTPLQVWAEKKGVAPEVEMTAPMKWGLTLEPVIAAEYEAQTGRRLYAPENVLHHPVHDFILCSPDRLVQGERRGVELKTASAYTSQDWGRPGTDQVPQQYLIQVLQCMAVTGLPAWDVAVLIGGSDFRIYTVRFDAGLWAEIESRLVAWWERYVVGDEEPPATAGDADWLDRRYPRERLDLLAPSVEAVALAAAYKQVRDEINEASERMDAAEAALKALIGEHEGLGDETFRVTWRCNKDREVTNWEAVARELAYDEDALREMAAKHTTTKPGPRVFRFFEKDAKR